MSTFTERTTINASRQDVWAALADIGTIATWNPGLIKSHRTNDIDGVGGGRHCDISTKHSLTEHVVEFEPGTAITFRITDTTLPFKTADIAFTLTDNAQQARTEVTVSPTYTLKYGPIGRILNTVAVRRNYRAGMCGLLEGLKTHLEQRC
ncbi:MAG: SRPBCC family protein [Acidimicrobiales bacterium]